MTRRDRDPVALQIHAGRGRHPGFFMVELLMGIVILSLAIIPLYQMFVTSSRTMFHSKLSYMAMHVAREQLEELRQIPFEKVASGAAVHDWRPVKGRMMEMTLAHRVADRTTSTFEADDYDYPDEYGRIETKLDVEEVEPKDDRMRKVVLLVRWQEKGESPKEVGAVGQRLALSRFETLIVSHSTEQP